MSDIMKQFPSLKKKKWKLEIWQSGKIARDLWLAPNRGKCSGQNGISHPHWVKICDEITTVILIYAPNKNSEFFLLHGQLHGFLTALNIFLNLNIYFDFFLLVEMIIAGSLSLKSKEKYFVNWNPVLKWFLNIVYIFVNIY